MTKSMTIGYLEAAMEQAAANLSLSVQQGNIKAVNQWKEVISYCLKNINKVSLLPA